jgi:hypothetical protein
MKWCDCLKIFVAETLRRRTDPKSENEMKLKEKKIEANE